MQDDCHSSLWSMGIYHLTCCMTKSHSTDVSLDPSLFFLDYLKKIDDVF